jgi:glycosyltransferase involved in cell wall biosynthesis
MLVECIKSILDQSFPDFEVLIGNDYTQDGLSLHDLGIDDPRVRIVNHAMNLGEVENMKYLLDHGSGEYFTWLADDDAYHPHFLRIAHDALRRDSALDCVFTNYWSADVWTSTPLIDPADVVATEIPTDQFLERYLTKQIRLLGCYGVFRSGFIRGLGGMRRAGTGFGPYSDNLLGIKAAASGRVAYIDQPLIFYRIHGASLSATSDSMEAYTSAQTDVAGEFERLVKERVTPAAYGRLQFYLFDWFVRDLAAVWGRNRRNLRLSRLFGFMRLVIGDYVSKLPVNYAMRLTAVTGRQVYLLAKQSIRAAIYSGLR